MAEQWKREGQHFAGLIFTIQDAPIGRVVEDLHLNALATEAEEWADTIVKLYYPR